MNFEKFLRTPFLREHLWWLLQFKMWLTLQFSIFLVSSLQWRYLVYFISAEKWNTLMKYPDGIQIFLFFLSLYRFVWHQRFQKKFDRWYIIWLENVFLKKRIWWSSFHGERNFTLECFLGGEHLMSSSTKTAQMINCKLCTHISYRLHFWLFFLVQGSI